MAIEFKVALEACKTAGEVVQHIWQLKAKLTAQPEPAAYELALALEQVHSTFRALLEEVARYKGLGVTPESLKERAHILAELEGQQLRSRVDAGRGHCVIIDNIYRKHLDKWFRGALSHVEYLHISADFSLLGEADRNLFDQMCSICDGLSSEATLVHDLILEQKWDLARERVLSARKGLLELEQVISQAMRTLSELKTELIAISGLTRL